MGKKKVAGTQNVRCTRGDGDCGRLSRKAPARHEPVVPLSALSLSDGAVRIFLNTRGKTEWEGNRTLVEFLRYVEDPAAPVESPEVILVRKRVAEVKRNEETEARYMTSLTYVREIYEDGRVDGEAEGEARGRAAGRKEGIAEGRKKGRAEGQIQDILDLLSDLGTVPDSLAGRILEEKDTVTLRRWIRLAAKAESHTDFKENM